MVIDQERTQFEAAMWTYYLDLKAKGWSAPGEGDQTPEALFWREESGKYGVLSVEAAWNGWQMARKSVVPVASDPKICWNCGAYPAAQPVEVPSDFHTHKNAWRSALEMAEQNALVNPPDLDDKSYWRHEIAAFDRAYSELGAQPVEVQPLTEELHAFLDAAAGEGLILGNVDAAELYKAAFPDRYAAHGIKPTSSEGGGGAA